MIYSIEKFSGEFLPTHEILRLISEIDEFKGKWTALRNLSPERLDALRQVATIESVSSSTRIEGVKLSDREILALLKEHAQLMIAEIEALTDANCNTLKVRLRELVRDDFIEQNGKGADNLVSLESQITDLKVRMANCHTSWYNLKLR